MFDVVLFGATGVTGREVARYLGRRAPLLGLSWAAAGRDRRRLEAALTAVGAAPAEILHADTADADSIDAMVASARVVANLVGPYAQHGEVVYEACIRHGASQLDLTGELDWLAAMMARHHDRAMEAGARIVPVAGFEALPFDLAALLVARAAHQRTGEAVAAVDVAVTTRSTARVRRVADAVSGGTWASALGVIRRGGSVGPYGLDPPSAAGPRPAGLGLGLRRHPGTGALLAPMVPSPVLNPPVAHRTAALLRAGGDPTFAPGYRYREGLVVGGPLGPALGVSLVAGQVSAAALARSPAPVRRAGAAVLARLGPAPGDGPREQDLDRWSYRLDVRATTTGGATADGVVEAAGHPGYRSTAFLVAEAALILADPSAVVPPACGFLTPATALGTDELARFTHAGATFAVLDGGAPDGWPAGTGPG
jgi:short subunit dehydrogenase-like uncharacterized protein